MTIRKLHILTFTVKAVLISEMYLLTVRKKCLMILWNQLNLLIILRWLILKLLILQGILQINMTLTKKAV